MLPSWRTFVKICSISIYVCHCPQVHSTLLDSSPLYLLLVQSFSHDRSSAVADTEIKLSINTGDNTLKIATNI